MKDMSVIYFNMPTHQLRTLKSKKYVRWEKLDRDKSYLAMQEKKKLVNQIKWIDAVLAPRGLQMKMPLE